MVLWIELIRLQKTFKNRQKIGRVITFYFNLVEKWLVIVIILLVSKYNVVKSLRFKRKKIRSNFGIYGPNGSLRINAYSNY